MLRTLQEGDTALMRAAWNGHTNTVAELVRLGADINARGKVRIR
jgi:ankyrin repeat protein